MVEGAIPDFGVEIGGALDWWREAGVDADFLDEPRVWLADPETSEGDAPPRAFRPAPRPVEVAPELPTLATLPLPDTLPAFVDWWRTEPLVGDGAAAGRVAPRGAAGARLMVLVEEPEAEDEGVLLGGDGPQGRLLAQILRAFGVAPDGAYVASALPRHTPAADWRAGAARGLGRVVAHHIGLVGPQRLLVLGGNALSLLGHEPPQAPAVLRSFKHEGGELPMLAGWALSALLNQPRAKAMLWRGWLEWTKG